MIVAAAIEHEGAVYALPAPARHHNVIWHINEVTGSTRVPASSVQGFIDSNFGFVDRVRALEIVRDENQELVDPEIKAGKMFSENLW